MFGMRTPTKPGGTRDRPSTSPGVPAATNKTTTKGTDAAGIAKRKVTARTKTPDPAPRSSLTGLMARALKLLNETKSQMDQSGNIKGSIKTTVLKNVQSLYELVRESEEKRETERRERESPTPFTPLLATVAEPQITPQIEEMRELLSQNARQMSELNERLEAHTKMMSTQTSYAEVAAKGALPECRNCAKAGLEGTNHNAFSRECPVRARWDAIARSTVAYC
ncbi:hypothetical protein ACJJTC_013690 [Scirpophaga incertulas]